MKTICGIVMSKIMTLNTPALVHAPENFFFLILFSRESNFKQRELIKPDVSHPLIQYRQ